MIKSLIFVVATGTDIRNTLKKNYCKVNRCRQYLAYHLNHDLRAFDCIRRLW